MGLQVTSTRAESSARGWLVRLDSFSKTLSIWLNRVAGLGLIAMLALVVADIIGIKGLARPIPGGIEIVAFLGVVVIGFAMSYTQVLKGHILVDFVTSKFPKRVQAYLEVLVLFLSLATFLILTWRAFEYARLLQTSGEVSMTQKIPFYPFVYALSFAALNLSLVLFVDMVKAAQKAVRK